MALCLRTDNQGDLYSAGQYTGDPAQPCVALALDPAEASYLATLEQSAGFYSPLAPADFLAYASWAGGIVVLAFVVSYLVGSLVRAVE